MLDSFQSIHVLIIYCAEKEYGVLVIVASGTICNNAFTIDGHVAVKENPL